MGPFNWLPFGGDPLTYLLYAVFSGVVYALVGRHWSFIPILLAGLVFWPIAVRWVRTAWRHGKGAVVGKTRKPGELYCPECSGSLAAPSSTEAFSHHLCADCQGKWCPSSVLTAGLSKKKKEPASWVAAKAGIEKEPLACPKCGEVMRCGGFVGAAFTTFRCEKCDGYWFNRIDWVSFELSLL